MAIDIAQPANRGSSREFDHFRQPSPWATVRKCLAPLASLRLTVALFVLAIFLILAGTVAQRFYSVEEALDRCFRVAWAKIELHWFLPRDSKGKALDLGSFYFPGGWIIGGAMMLNLFAAHALRFKVQAKGKRLWGGLGVIALGCLVTWLVIASGSEGREVQDYASLGWSGVWTLLKGLSCVAWLAGVALLITRNGLALNQKIVWGICLAALGVILGGLIAFPDIIPDPSSMRILWQLIKAEFASLSLLLGCWLVFRKRGPIVLLHAGVGLMMVNELVVAISHVESMMPIVEGQAVNYSQITKRAELALVDPTSSKTDDVTVVPSSLWSEGERFESDDLPVTIEALEYFRNSAVVKLDPKVKNLATRGVGLDRLAIEEPDSAGTDSEAKVSYPSAYVRFTDRQGTDLGVYLLSAFETQGQTLRVDGQDLEVSLRFERVYKPFSIHLNEFRHDRYLGTDTARNFSSEVSVVDHERGSKFEKTISMNNPLRYAGETFYQASYVGEDVTVLQVMKNYGWMIPYVGCMIVVTGILAQFLATLNRFLNRRAAAPAVAVNKAASHGQSPRPGKRGAVNPTPDKAGLAAVILPVIVGLWFAGYLWGRAQAPAVKPDEFDLSGFGGLPVVYQGRAKPFDTLARDALNSLGNTDSFQVGDEQTFFQIISGRAGVKTPAIQWLIDLIADPQKALNHRVIRIDNDDVLDFLELKPRRGRRYAIGELLERVEAISEECDEIRKIDPAARELFQQAMLDLETKLHLVNTIQWAFVAPPKEGIHYLTEYLMAADYSATTQLPLAAPVEGEKSAWQSFLAAKTGMSAQRRMSAELQANGRELNQETRSIWDLASGAERFAPYLEQLLRTPNPSVEALDKILVAYAAKDTKGFNSAVASYHRLLERNPPEGFVSEKIALENYLNRFNPFGVADAFYLIAAIMAALSWIGWSKPLRRASFTLVVMVFVFHTLALCLRIYISGRPPVTNLYSSAVFIGWGGVALGMLIESLRRAGTGLVISGISGWATLLIASYLARTGDTMAVLQAVLDTQFWLSTHVVCVSLGYAATLFAGQMGLFLLLQGVLTPWQSDHDRKEQARAIYGVICCAMFLSFFGTVLGGLWADDSWGRFWGWDPKENGAMIIVLWNAVVLHARWGALVKERGLAMLAVVGNIAVAWSWFGVNELGVGKHSYGFTQGIKEALVIYIASQLVILGVGAIPFRFWGSIQKSNSLEDADDTRLT